MIELVILFRELIAVISHQSRAVIVCRLTDGISELPEKPDKVYLFIISFNTGIITRIAAYSCLICFSEHRFYPCIGILNEWTRITIKINRFGRVKCHILLWIDFKNEVFQCSHSNFSENLILFSPIKIGELPKFL